MVVDQGCHTHLHFPLDAVERGDACTPDMALGQRGQAVEEGPVVRHRQGHRGRERRQHPRHAPDGQAADVALVGVDLDRFEVEGKGAFLGPLVFRRETRGIGIGLAGALGHKARAQGGEGRQEFLRGEQRQRVQPFDHARVEVAAGAVEHDHQQKLGDVTVVRCRVRRFQRDGQAVLPFGRGEEAEVLEAQPALAVVAGHELLAERQAHGVAAGEDAGGTRVDEGAVFDRMAVVLERRRRDAREAFKQRVLRTVADDAAVVGACMGHRIPLRVSVTP